MAENVLHIDGRMREEGRDVRVRKRERASGVFLMTEEQNVHLLL